MKTPKIIPSKYKTKAEGVVAMLNAGYTPKQIRERMSVSYSYIHTLKTKMAKAEEARGRPCDNECEPVAPPEIDTILDQRGSRYGNFLDHARITQRLKKVAHQFAADNEKRFDVDQAEALDMIFHKIGRILNGDPNYADSWIDIAGYAKLVADRLEGKIR